MLLANLQTHNLQDIQETNMQVTVGQHAGIVIFLVLLVIF